jgi:RND family efflux transporter MFP subunit
MTARRLTAIGLGATVLVAVVMVATGLRSSSDQMPTIRVSPADYVRRVTAEGQLKAVRSTPLTVSVQWVGRPYQVAWLIADGSRVAEGEVVARFDPTDLERDLEEGRADGEIADANIEKAEVEREGSLHNLDRDAEVSKRELEVAERFQATDTQLYSRMEIIEAEIDTDLAEHRSEHAEQSKEIQDHLSRADLDLLEIERRQAELKVEQAQQGLDGLELVSPHDGIVLIDRNWQGERLEVGDTAFPGRTIATIPDLNEMEAEVYVLEADAGGLAAGQRATVVVEAHPELEYAATVKSVDPVAQRRYGWSPVQYFRTVLELEGTDPAIMKPGQTVSAEIILEEHASAIVIPRQAVSEEDGRTVVHRREGGDFEPVEVTVGATGLGRVVITSGLQEGDRIALRDPDRSPATGTGGNGTSSAVGGLE